MDLVGYERGGVRRIEAEYRQFAESLGIAEVTAIPLSALQGDNVVDPQHAHAVVSAARPCSAISKACRVDRSGSDGPFRMPVQWVNRPDQSFRGFSGTIAAGSIQPGDRVKVMPSGRDRHRPDRHLDGDLDRAVAGQSMTMTLADEVDVGRGDVVMAASAIRRRSPTSSRRSILWMGDEPMLPGRLISSRCGTRTVRRRWRSRNTRSMSTRWSTWRRARSSSTRSASCNLELDAADRL